MIRRVAIFIAFLLMLKKTDFMYDGIAFKLPLFSIAAMSNLLIVF